MILYPYKLEHTRDRNADSGRAVERLTDMVLFQASAPLPVALTHPSESDGETGVLDSSLVECLLLGVLWNEYVTWAQRINQADLSLAAVLCNIRERSPEMKGAIDEARAKVYADFFHLQPDNGTPLPTVTAAGLERFLLFLEGMGDYSRTVDVLRPFVLCLACEGADSLARQMETLSQFAHWFKGEAGNQLGGITQTCSDYRCAHRQTSKLDAEALLRNRSVVEYHLNLVVAELMQRQNMAGFLTAGRTMVVVPRCLCENQGDDCLADFDGHLYTCNHCSSTCQVARIDRMCREYDAELILLAHSSNFSDWIDNPSRVEDAGIIGIACIANLVEGGLEGRRRDIPVTCVPLDHPGCNHWHGTDMGSQVNLDTLERLLEKKGSQASETDSAFPLPGLLRGDCLRQIR